MEAATAVLRTFGSEFACEGVQLGARYDLSSIIEAEAEAPVADVWEAYQPTAHPCGEPDISTRTVPSRC